MIVSRCPHVPGMVSSAGHPAESKTNTNLIFVLTDLIVYWDSYSKTPTGVSLNELLKQKKVFFPGHKSIGDSLKKKNEAETISHSSQVEEGNPVTQRLDVDIKGNKSEERNSGGVGGLAVVVMSEGLTCKWEIEPLDHRKVNKTRLCPCVLGFCIYV